MNLWAGGHDFSRRRKTRFGWLRPGTLRRPRPYRMFLRLIITAMSVI